jgi:hypothetical protein
VPSINKKETMIKGNNRKGGTIKLETTKERTVKGKWKRRNLNINWILENIVLAITKRRINLCRNKPINLRGAQCKHFS